MDLRSIDFIILEDNVNLATKQSLVGSMTLIRVVTWIPNNQ
jgi:hypothetical protein